MKSRPRLLWTASCARTAPMISAAVHQFLADYVDSAELLDILMLLYSEPNEAWTPEKVSNRVFTVPQAAERRLEELKERGLAAEPAGKPGAYTLQSGDPQTTAVLAELRDAYKASRANVINAVFSMRSDPLKSFSNAFKLRGK